MKKCEVCGKSHKGKGRFCSITCRNKSQRDEALTKLPAYVYVHRRLSTDTIFYVGKGSGNRYKSPDPRNMLWAGIVNEEGGFRAQIIKLVDTPEQACNYEGLLMQHLPDAGVELTNKFNNRQPTIDIHCIDTQDGLFDRFISI